MPKFVIEPHFRLQEWVAEHGIFANGAMGPCEYERSIAALAP
jgi:hypothetical protein